MEPEGSLPHLQVPATCPYPEPDQSNPCPPSHFLNVNLNVLPSRPESLSLRFPYQTLHTPLLSPLLLHAPPITRTILGKEYRSLSCSLCSFPHSPVSSSLLVPNILLCTLFSNILSLRSSLDVSDQVSHPYKITSKNIFLCILTKNIKIL